MQPEETRRQWKEALQKGYKPCPDKIYIILGTLSMIYIKGDEVISVPIPVFDTFVSIEEVESTGGGSRRHNVGSLKSD